MCRAYLSEVLFNYCGFFIVVIIIVVVVVIISAIIIVVFIIIDIFCYCFFI